MDKKKVEVVSVFIFTCFFFLLCLCVMYVYTGVSQDQKGMFYLFCPGINPELGR